MVHVIAGRATVSRISIGSLFPGGVDYVGIRTETGTNLTVIFGRESGDRDVI